MSSEREELIAKRAAETITRAIPRWFRTAQPNGAFKWYHVEFKTGDGDFAAEVLAKHLKHLKVWRFAPLDSPLSAATQWGMSGRGRLPVRCVSQYYLADPRTGKDGMIFRLDVLAAPKPTKRRVH